MTRKSLIALFAVMAIAGCGRNTDEFSQAMPESSAFQIEVTGDVSTEGLSMSIDDEGDDAIYWNQQALGGPLPEYLQHAKDAVRALNQAVARILDPIADLIKNNPQAQTGDSRVYVKDRGNATYRFAIKKVAANRYGWLLQAKPLGAADSAYVAVMGGTFVKGEQPRRGRGSMGIDLTRLAQVDPSFKGTGQLLVGFAHVGGYKILNYGLKSFSPDTTQHTTVDALFSGVRGPNGGTNVKLAFHGNVADTKTTAKELVVLHARWLPGVGGRSDALATGGDVAAGHVIVAFSCFDGNLADGNGFVWVADCLKGSIGQNCTVLNTKGKPENCAPAYKNPELPPEDPNAPQPNTDAPESPEVPGTIPDGNG